MLARMSVEMIAPERILIGKRLRPLDPAKVSDLMDSIATFGLQTPISVWASSSDEIHLVAGHHRLEAVKSLGLIEIPCALVDMDERDRRLWEIAENLHRSELTVQERSEHIAEWVRLTAEGKFHAAQVEPHRKAGQQPGGINAATRELGIDRNEAQRAVKIASMTDEAKAAAKAAGLDDTQSALLEIAKEAPERQTEKVAELQQRREAKKVQHDGEAEDQASPAPDDPTEPAETAKLRRQLMRLTHEALVDEVIGLRAEIAERKKVNAGLKAEIEIHKADLAAFRQGDLGRALGNAQRELRTVKGRMDEYQALAVKADRKLKAVEKENASLKSSLENQMIPLNQ